MSKEDSDIKNSTKDLKEYSKKIGDYILLDQIGKGTFSKVSRAFHTISEQIVAVKILDKNKIEDEIDIERINREIEILSKIYHPNICQMYETYTTIHNYYLMMEYISGGDLFDYITKNKYLEENKACYYFRQLISAMEYLSSLGIAHRDIKPENILLNEDYTQIKLIDFGLSNYAENNELLKSSCGSPCYASPEMLSGKPYSGFETDIWSAGIVLYSMLVGGLPFDDEELKSLYEQIKEGKFYIPSTLSLEAIDLLKKILRVEPEKRITIKELKKHSWFNMEKNIIYKGINFYNEKMPFDAKIVKYIIKKYFSEDNISLYNFIWMIKDYACNKYTATYYLVKKYVFKKDDICENDNENKLNKNKKKISDKYKMVYEEIKDIKEEINTNIKNNNNIFKKVPITRNIKNICNNLNNYDDSNNINNTDLNKNYNFVNLTTKENQINKKEKIDKNNILLSDNKEKEKKIESKNVNIKIKKKKGNNNMVLIKNKPKIKNNRNNQKKKDISGNNSEIKLGLSLINIIGVNDKNKITENITDRNINEKYKNTNNKIYYTTNSNIKNDSNSLNKTKNVNKNNKKIKTYLDNIFYPKKGGLNFYVINNIINKEKLMKKKKAKNELFNLEINSNINKKNYLSTTNNENIIVNINNNNFINNSINKNNFQNLHRDYAISPKNKNQIKNNSSQIKVNLKSSEDKINYQISPKNRILMRKTEKNSPKNYIPQNIFNKKINSIIQHKKTISPSTTVNIKTNNKISNFIKLNRNSKEKYLNIINKEKIKQVIINHRKIKSLCNQNQNNTLFNYFHDNKKNNFHKRNISSAFRSQLSDIKNDTYLNYLNTITNNKNISNDNNTILSYSEEKMLKEKNKHKPKNKILKKKNNNLIILDNKDNDLNSLIIEKLKKRSNLTIFNNISKNKNYNIMNKNNKNSNYYYLGLSQSNSSNNFRKINQFII